MALDIPATSPQLVEKLPRAVQTTDQPRGGGRQASYGVSPVPAPPSADPKSSSVNLFYALANPGGAIAPGQRLNAKLARTDQAKVLAVPAAAVIWDVFGNPFVYELVAPHTYARRRVDVLRTTGGFSALGAGTAEGMTVVVQGVAELYGAETGVEH